MQQEIAESLERLSSLHVPIDHLYDAAGHAISVVKREFCSIHETPDKEKTAAQHERLKQLRQTAAKLGDIRYECVRRMKTK